MAELHGREAKFPRIPRDGLTPMELYLLQHQPITNSHSQEA